MIFGFAHLSVIFGKGFVEDLTTCLGYTSPVSPLLCLFRDFGNINMKKKQVLHAPYGFKHYQENQLHELEIKQELKYNSV